MGLKSKAAIGVGVSSAAAYLYAIDPEVFTKYMSDAASNHMAQAGFWFTLAAWVHSSQVKKEIATQFLAITTALDGVASALKADLSAQLTRISKVEDVVLKMDNRISALETKEK